MAVKHSMSMSMDGKIDKADLQSFIDNAPEGSTISAECTHTAGDYNQSDQVRHSLNCEWTT